MDSDEPVRVPLADAIAGVRSELNEAMLLGEGQEPYDARIRRESLAYADDQRVYS
jgi:hypothetical protein